ncbi:hypothetical protein EDC18_10973 [Natranaerovirga pectinivora]|uniref:Uncharacterized protein n=1 Tax=Natranaerovirga pectinivora TaxID=682400 RepID=A0A4R3MKZ2_9FIRM|nr:hypothetical protein EDC18_10973 [Natranaerovirga pectinivora]
MFYKAKGLVTQHDNRYFQIERHRAYEKRRIEELSIDERR